MEAAVAYYRVSTKQQQRSGLGVEALRAEGTITIGGVTQALNERKIPTARGSRWHVSSVANLLARA